MKDLSKNNLVNEIEDRLDDFFGEKRNHTEKHINQSGKQVDSLEKLKSIVLNIDWEITDQSLSDLINESERLLPQYETDRMSHALLRMLRSLGLYIRKRKAQAHPDAIKRIMSVYASFDKIVHNQDTEDGQKKTILAEEISSFKKLKQQIDIKKPAPAATNGKPQQAVNFDHKGIDQEMSAVEQRLRSEIEELKNQINELKSALNLLHKP